MRRHSPDHQELVEPRKARDVIDSAMTEFRIALHCRIEQSRAEQSPSSVSSGRAQAEHCRVGPGLAVKVPDEG